jgi:membrane fusion protein (multidrug efflux system)
VAIRIRITRIIATAAVAAAGACHKAEEAAPEETHPSVGGKTVVVTAQPFTETLASIGTVVGRSGHVATLSAPAAGRVGQVLVTTGQTVQTGQVLVDLDQTPFLATLQAAEAALAAAQRSADRQQRLAQEGIVARKDAELAVAELAKAKADEVAARRAEQLSTIRSPISGVITRMSATLGASVDPAQPLVEITDPRALDILMSVTPTDAARVRPGARTTLSAGQSASGEPLGVGSVVDISGIVDSTTRSVAVRVQAPTTRRPLRVGETIFGAIAVSTKPAAIVIPAEALVPDGDKFKVFVVDANGVAHEREVEVGGKTSTMVEITDGLKVGERIVSYGAYGMQDSAKVVPITPAADSAPKSELPAPTKGESPSKPAKP